MTAPLRLVPFDGLWEMAIDVPYSMLAGRGDLAWSCGQLALGAGARVQAPGDLLAQADIVADHLDTILRRAGLDRSVFGVWSPTTCPRPSAMAPR